MTKNNESTTMTAEMISLKNLYKVSQVALEKNPGLKDVASAGEISAIALAEVVKESTDRNKKFYDSEDGMLFQSLFAFGGHLTSIGYNMIEDSLAIAAKHGLYQQEIKMRATMLCKAFDQLWKSIFSGYRMEFSNGGSYLKNYESLSCLINILLGHMVDIKMSDDGLTFVFEIENERKTKSCRNCKFCKTSACPASFGYDDPLRHGEDCMRHEYPRDLIEYYNELKEKGIVGNRK